MINTEEFDTFKILCTQRIFMPKPANNYCCRIKLNEDRYETKYCAEEVCPRLGVGFSSACDTLLASGEDGGKCGPQNAGGDHRCWTGYYDNGHEHGIYYEGDEYQCMDGVACTRFDYCPICGKRFGG